MKKLYYTTKITVEVNQGTDDEVCDQLDAVILPAARDLTWVLSGLSDFPDDVVFDAEDGFIPTKE